MALLNVILLLSQLLLIDGAGLMIETLEKPEKCKKITKQGDWLKVHYKGVLAKDGSQFDSSYDRDEPFEFLLGNSEVIQGWDQGLIGMCVGEVRQLTVPPQLGYGAKGAGDVIPGDATLVFDIELVAIEAAPKPNNIFKDIDKDGDNLLSQDEVRAYVNEKSALTDMAQGPSTQKEIDILIQYIFRENDKNRDGFLEPSEWHVPPSFQQEKMKRVKELRDKVDKGEKEEKMNGNKENRKKKSKKDEL